jgi:hypothetical protein
VDVPAAISINRVSEGLVIVGPEEVTHKTTEQNPKSALGLAELKNFFLEMYFPRITPSTSIPSVMNNGTQITAYATGD